MSPATIALRYGSWNERDQNNQEDWEELHDRGGA